MKPVPPNAVMLARTANRVAGEFNFKPAEGTDEGEFKVRAASEASVLLASVSLGSADTLIYKAQTRIKMLVVYGCNVDTSARTFELHHVLSGGSAADSNARCKAAPLGVGKMKALYIPGMEVGEMLRGLCDSANKVTVSVYGVMA